MGEVKKADKAVEKFIETLGQRARKDNIRTGKKRGGNTQPEKLKQNVNTSNWVYGFVGD